MGFPRQEYRSGLPFPSPGIEPASPVSPVSQVDFLPAEPGGLSWYLVSKDWCVLPRSQLLLPSALHRPPSRCRLSGPHWFDITSSSSSRPPLHWFLWTFYLSYFLVLCFVAQSCLALCDPWTVASQALLSMGILQARILEWVAMPSPRVSSQPRDRTQVSCIAGRFFKLSYQGRPHFLNLSLFLFCCPASPF